VNTQEVTTILDVVQTIGVIGILALVAWAFYTGQLISSKVNDKIIGVYQKEVEKLTNGFSSKMEDLGGKMVEVCKTNEKVLDGQGDIVNAVKHLGPKLDEIKNTLLITSARNRG